MKNTFAAFVWSLEVVVFSYRTVAALAVLAALWCSLAYEWLGLPESSALMLILALAWAIAQILAGVTIVGGIVSGVVKASVAEGLDLPVSSLWRLSRKDTWNTLIFLILCALGASLCYLILGWVNGHALEVSSFLTFHLQRPVSHARIEEFFGAMEYLIWIILIGYLLSLFTTLMREGWRGVRRHQWKLMTGSVFQSPFLASLLSAGVVGFACDKVSNWHHTVPPGFWDYFQVIGRYSFILLLISAGGCFWVLFLARLQSPREVHPEN